MSDIIRSVATGDTQAVAQLNEKVVAALPVPPAGNKVYTFTGAVLQGIMAPPGFGVCVTKNGVRSFVLNYKRRGAHRRYTIGRWPTRTALLAVKEARELRRRIDKREDPLADRRQDKTDAENLFKDIYAEYHRLVLLSQ
jgi:Arm DNA-binding domain